MYRTIALPARPQIDTLVAVFLLKELGEKRFPGIKDASVVVWHALPPGKDERSLEEEGVVLVDIGRGRFDHHELMPQTTATDLIAQYLGFHDDPAVAKLIAFVRRDDFFGKGIISEDALDRAFGLPGLLSNVNKQNPDDAQKVFDIALPLVAAHYREEVRRTKEMPEEVARLTTEGNLKEFSVRQRDKNLKVGFVVSENASLVGFLRSQIGGRYDVVAHQYPSGHVNVVARPTKRPDLRKLTAEIRKAEAKHLKVELPNDFRYLDQPGKIREVPMWYFHPPTGSIQNGGANSSNTPPTKIPREEWPELLRVGLEMLPPPSSRPASPRA